MFLLLPSETVFATWIPIGKRKSFLTERRRESMGLGNEPEGVPANPQLHLVFLNENLVLRTPFVFWSWDAWKGIPLEAVRFEFVPSETLRTRKMGGAANKQLKIQAMKSNGWVNITTLVAQNLDPCHSLQAVLPLLFFVSRVGSLVLLFCFWRAVSMLVGTLLVTPMIPH